MSLVILFHFLRAQHVSDINISIIRSLRACNTDTTPTQRHRNSNTHRTKNNTTNVVIQQNSRKLLMMDILMSETCWTHKKGNKIASDIKLVFYSSTTILMHGPINTRMNIYKCTKPGLQLPMSTKFRKLAPNIWRSPISKLLHITVLMPKIFCVTSRIFENVCTSDVDLHVNCPLHFPINIFMKFNSVVFELLQEYRRTNEKISLDGPRLHLNACACKNYWHRYVEICDRFVRWSGVKPVIRRGRNVHDYSVVYFYL